MIEELKINSGIIYLIVLAHAGLNQAGNKV